MNGQTLNVFVLIVYTVNMDYLHEQHTVHLIVYHIIWCPKRRRRILRGEIAQRLEQLVNEVALEQNWQVLNLSIQPDHVHLFIQANPYTLPTDIARLIGSLVGDNHVEREAALDAYHEMRPLTALDRQLIDALDRSGLVIGAFNWLTWLYVERRDMGPTEPIVHRLDEIIRRLW